MNQVSIRVSRAVFTSVVPIIMLTAVRSWAGSNQSAIPPPSEAKTSARPPHAAKVAYPLIPLAFEENIGQTDARVRYLARANGYTVFLTDLETVIRFASAPREGASADGDVAAPNLPVTQPIDVATVSMRFIGANAKPNMSADGPPVGISNYFVGSDPRRHAIGVRRFSRIVYSNLYPEIDAAFYGDQQRLEYDLLIKPGGDPSSIRLAIGGAHVTIKDDGSASISSGSDTLSLKPPSAYQGTGSARVNVAARYRLVADNEIAIEVGSYDPNAVLVIDPVLANDSHLSYSSILGGFGEDVATGIGVDSQGNAIVGGYTLSSDFALATDTGARRSGIDAFVAKLNRDATGFLYITFLGGSDNEYGWRLAADRAGNAYIAGYTYSADFFTTPRAFQRSLAGADDAFVAKLGPSGIPEYSTYIGGTSSDRAFDIAIDGAGSAYVVGGTLSADFPVTMSAYGGDLDAFLLKLSPDGRSLVYATYVGGSSEDSAYGVAIDATGAAYVAGYTLSNDFMTTGTAPQRLKHEFKDAYVRKYSPDGRSIAYSTFIAGNADDIANSIAVDSSSSAYVVGQTGSSDFPLAAPALPIFQERFNWGTFEAFVTKITPGGDGFYYSTYIGGMGDDGALNVAVDRFGNAYITGWTGSANFPVTPDAYEQHYSWNSFDGFFSKVAADGRSLLYSTFIGGIGSEIGHGIALDPSADAYVAGVTGSIDFTVTPKVVEPTYHLDTYAADGSSDAFVLKIRFPHATPIPFPGAISFGSVTVGTQVRTPLTITNAGNVLLHVSSIALSNPSIGFQVAPMSCADVDMFVGMSCTAEVSFAPSVIGSAETRIEILTDAPDSPVFVPVSGVGAPPDVTPPTISIAVPGPNATYQLNQSVAAAYSCVDDSGVASCIGDVATGSAIDTATTGRKTFVITATDTSGNQSTASVTYTVVDGVQTSTAALNSSLNPSLSTRPPIFTAIVSVPEGITPTGSVEFFDGTTSIGVSPVRNDSGRFFATLGGAGLAADGNPHSITARYSGDTNTAPSTSAVLVQTVNPGTYQIVDLGTLGGSSAGAVGIDEAGRVYGASTIADEISWHLFTYDNGVMRDVGVLGAGSDVTDANATGDIVGERSTVIGAPNHAFVYHQGTVGDLGTLGGAYSVANAINDGGMIAGDSETSAQGPLHAFRWDRGTMTDLGTLGGNESHAFAINAQGLVAGQSSTAAGGFHAFVFDTTMHDIRTLGGRSSSIEGLNAYGEAVGSSTDPSGADRAFLYRGGTLIPLGTFGGSISQANAINDAGEIVGYAYLPGDASAHPFLYDGRSLRDLGQIGDSVISSAVDVNNNGQISIQSQANGSDRVHFYTGGRIVDLSAMVAPNWNGGGIIKTNSNGQLAVTFFEQTSDRFRSFLFNPITLATATLTLTVAPEINAVNGGPALTATLSAQGAPVGDKTVTFSVNGAVAGSAITNASGVATLRVNLAGVPAGTYPGGIHASFAGDSALTASSTTADLTIVQITPIVTWGNLAPIVAGTPLGPAQLNAVASVPGTFEYQPPAGTVLPAGEGQTLSVSFVPSDLARYQRTTKTIAIDVTSGQLRATTVTLTSSLNPSISTKPPVLRATIVPQDSGTPTGMVEFLDNGTPVGKSPLRNVGGTFVATLGGAKLTVGPHTIAARYGGDARFAASTSSDLRQSVQAGTFRVAALGTLGGSTAAAGGINRNGDVVGFSATAGGERHAFLYRNGSTTDLGTLGGVFSSASAINDAGQIVGTSSTIGTGPTHAFFYENGTMVDAGSFGGVSAGLGAINRAGQATGNATMPSGTQHAVFFSEGVLRDLGTFGGSNSNGARLNDSGEVVGGAHVPGDVGYHAFVFAAGTMADLGTLGGAVGAASAINAFADVVGSAAVSNGPQHPFLYRNGSMVDLAPLTGGSASAVNDSGQIAGLTSITAPGRGRATLWDENGAADLGTLGGSSSSVAGADAINAAGEVVGASNIAGDIATHAFVYTGGQLLDLDTLLPSKAARRSSNATRISDNAQVLVGSTQTDQSVLTFLLTPVPVARSTTLTLANASAPFGGSVRLIATLLSADGAVAGQDVTFTAFNAAAPVTVSTDASGVASASISVAGLGVGTYGGALTATFGGTASFLASSAVADLHVTPNQPPNASFTVRDTVVGQPTIFDASASFDVDGSIVRYEWDFNNDGTFEVSSDQPVATHTFLAAGSFLVSLRVIDNSGAAGTISQQVVTTATGIFTATSTMNASRYLHAATQLGDGTVLLTGGFGNTGYLPSAEIYFSGNRIFEPTNGSMSIGRARHTATWLADGTVLIAGGEGFASGGGSGPPTSLSSAEIYDPATRTFSRTGDMSAARSDHTATLLADGTVLITGGFAEAGGDSWRSSAEIYDPATRTFSKINDMSFSRHGHTATLLTDGTVLIAGGYGNNGQLGPVSSAEIYNPTTRTFSVVGNMREGRYHHTATRLNDGTVLLAAGYGNNGNSSSAEIYDFSTRTFSTVADLSMARSAHQATLLYDGTVLITGGYGNSGYLASSEIYSSLTRTFVASGNMSMPRYLHAATLLNDRTVVINGGLTGGGVPVASAELYLAPGAVPLDIAPKPLRFGEQFVGTVSEGQPLYVTNIGTATITMGGGGITGGSFFWEGPDNQCTNHDLAPGQSCAVLVKFFPQTTGTRKGTLTFSTATGAYAAASVIGVGVEKPATRLEVYPTSAAFGGHAWLTAVLTGADGPLAEEIVTFRLDGSIVGKVETDVRGTARLSIPIAGLNAGAYPGAIGASFGGTWQWSASSGAGDLVVLKARPTVTWMLPDPIRSDTPLTSVQLSATADVPGTFTYDPPQGTTLDPRIHTLTATFAPADVRDYETVTTQVELTVTRVDDEPPIIDVSSPSEPIYERGSTLVARYSCSDDSGSVVSCTGSVANGATLDTSTPGPKSLTITATDAAGNTATATLTYAVSFGACMSPLDGLTAWLAGDGAAEESVTGVEAIWTGTATYGPGKAAQAFSVGNGNYASLPFQQIGPFTLQAWIRTPDRLLPEFTGILATGRPDQSATSLQIELDGTGNYRLNAGNSDISWLIGPATDFFQLVTVTFDGSVIAVYLNGRLVEAGVWTGTPALGFHVLNLGIDGDGAYPFAGLIDEVQVFNRALTDAEIVQTFLSGESGFCKNHPPVAAATASPNPGEATSSSGAIVMFDGSASTDPDGDALSYAWSEGSSALGTGSTLSAQLSIGSHSITLTVDDGRHKTDSTDILVVVRDTTSPALDGVPTDITLEATGPSGAIASWTDPTATDVVDGAVAVVCAPVSGSLFALGTAPVTCWASDARGNMASSTFGVVVRDTISPALNGVPQDVVAEATSAAGATVNWPSPTATDVVDGAVPVACVPASNTAFALGTTRVNCSATDAHGNTSIAGFNVVVGDTTAPVLSLPSQLVAEAMSAAGAAVSYAATATDLVGGNVAVTCAPASGSGFAIGITPVSCSASDAAGNTAVGGFNVVVADMVAPIVRTTSPSPDAMLTGPSVDVVLDATDLIGVDRLTVNGVPAVLTTGTPQSGTWRATVPISLPVASGAALTFDARATDTAGNTGSGMLAIDNDGIPSQGSAGMDRARVTAVDQSNAYSSEFNNGTTAGTLTRNGWTIRLSGAPTPGGVRATISGSGGIARISTCTGAAKEVRLDVVGETADFSCDHVTGTITVKAISAVPQIELREQLSTGAWQVFLLRSGQSMSVGSPATASADNSDPIEAQLVVIDDAGAEAVVGTYQLAPGASVDVSLIPGAPGEDIQIGFDVLRGEVSATVSGVTRKLLAGDRAALPIDHTPPVVSCEAADTEWHRANVAIACVASDNGSGLASATDASFVLMTSVVSGAESNSSGTDSRQVCDVAGNCIVAGPITGIRVDRKPPRVSAQSTPTTLWPPNGRMILVTVSGEVDDGGSGIRVVSYSVVDSEGAVKPGGVIPVAADGRYSTDVPLQASRNGANRSGRLYTVTIVATDAVGNTASAKAIVTVPHDQRGQ